MRQAPDVYVGNQNTTRFFSDPNDVCPATCPPPCPAALICPGAIVDIPGGCPVTATCMPITFGNNGGVCQVACPVACSEDQMSCDGGFDANGCQLPNTCVPNQGW